MEPTWAAVETLTNSRILDIPQNAASKIKIIVKSSQNDFTDAFTGQIYALKLLLTGKFNAEHTANLKKFGDSIREVFDESLIDTLDELWLKIFECSDLKELSHVLQKFVKKASQKIPSEWCIKRGNNDDYDSILMNNISACVNSGNVLSKASIRAILPNSKTTDGLNESSVTHFVDIGYRFVKRM